MKHCWDFSTCTPTYQGRPAHRPVHGVRVERFHADGSVSTPLRVMIGSCGQDPTSKRCTKEESGGQPNSPRRESRSYKYNGQVDGVASNHGLGASRWGRRRVRLRHPSEAGVHSFRLLIWFESGIAPQGKKRGIRVLGWPNTLFSLRLGGGGGGVFLLG